MRRIYTRTGDDGTTAIHGGTRVPKTDIRIEANGSVDELNVAIGTARTFLGDTHPWQQPLKEIQLTLMSVMSRVATPAARRADNPNILPADMVRNVEELIDSIASACGAATHFILPGGTPATAFLHQARVAARRAERRLWQLNACDSVERDVLMYINRLSDLFFIMARSEMTAHGIEEEKWKLFAYNRQKK